MPNICYQEIKENAELRTYIQKGDDLLGALGYTEHAFVHANIVAENAATVLTEFGYSDREVELVKMAGYLHDIGNLINRDGHAQSGALLAFNTLTRLGMDSEETVLVVSAIGNHDEVNGQPINPLAAALILADKSDVRRTRVRNTEFATFDIHDRVNYAVEKSTLSVDKQERNISLHLSLDTAISSKMEYFEIFLLRMMMCRKAAIFLGGTFELLMNRTKLL